MDILRALLALFALLARIADLERQVAELTSELDQAAADMDHLHRTIGYLESEQC